MEILNKVGWKHLYPLTDSLTLQSLDDQGTLENFQ